MRIIIYLNMAHFTGFNNTPISTSGDYIKPSFNHQEGSIDISPETELSPAEILKKIRKELEKQFPENLAEYKNLSIKEILNDPEISFEYATLLKGNPFGVITGIRNDLDITFTGKSLREEIFDLRKNAAPIKNRK